MNQVRELVFYRNHFHDFFDKQSEKAKEKIDYVLFLLTHIDKVPEKFLKHIEDRKDIIITKQNWATGIIVAVKK